MSAVHARVAIIGSGFAGLGTAVRLKRAGIDDFVILERAGDVGGVWRDNTYPGCACDVQSHLYSFSFAPNPRWSRSYSPQAEILAYLKDCATRYGLLSHVRFGRAVEDASWDDRAKRWYIKTSAGDFTAEVLVAGVGALSDPIIPHLRGLDRFEGKWFHSARWDHRYDLTNKRVAVIGTGASAIQFVPEIAPKVKHLDLYQRTPPWIIPRNDRPIGDVKQTLYRALPSLQWLARAGIYAAREALAIGFFYPEVMRVARHVAEKHLDAQVADATLRTKLTPSYTIGCKRILISDEYYPALQRSNVEVISDGIDQITKDAIVTKSGERREVDAILLGTGFHVTDPPIAKMVRGRGGATLDEVWKGSPKAHLGTTIAGFPNFFLLFGPNTGLGHTSVVTMLESQIELVMNAIHFMDDKRAASVEPTEEAQAAFIREVDEKMRGTVWTSGNCKSWYLDATGRNSAIWPGFTFTFAKRIERFVPSEYRVEPRGG